MITFLWPLMFLLLPLPLLVRRFARPVAPGVNGALRVPFFRSLAQGAGTGSTRRGRHPWRLVFSSLIWLLLVTAAARPALVGPEQPLPAEGRDLMLAIDLSGSMGQTDFAIGGRPSTRLDVVKEAARDFINRRRGDRVGLVLFSDRAYLQAPLTFDRAVVADLLEQAKVGLTGQKTAIGDAIAVGVKRLKDRPAEGRVLVLLTDGASNAGSIEPMAAAELARDLGIRIYTIGVGAEAMAMQTQFGPRMVNPSEDLDERSLTRIADLTGGQYFRATDVKGLAEVYHDIDLLEPVSGDPTYVRPTVALFYWPAGVAFLLAMLMTLQSVLTGWRSDLGARSPTLVGVPQ